MNSLIRSRVAPLSLFSFVVLAAAVACGGGSDTPTAPSVNVPFSRTDLRIGTGTEATAGRRATVNYSGWLYAAGAVDNKGQLFDSGSTAFTVGSRDVISGFDQGVNGMRVGGLRHVIIPPELGYGAQGRPPSIPPNATLVFDIELTNVQ